MKQFVCNTVATAGFVAMVWLIAIMALTTPIGYYADGTCVAVENRAGQLVRCAAAPRHEEIRVPSGTTFEMMEQRFGAAARVP